MPKKTRIGGVKKVTQKKKKEALPLSIKGVKNVIPGLCPLGSTPRTLTRRGGPQVWNPCRCHKLLDWTPAPSCITGICGANTLLFYLLDHDLD